MSDPMPQAPLVPPPPPPAPLPPVAPPRRRGLVAGAIAVAVALLGGTVAFVLTQRGGAAEAQPLALRFTEGQSSSYEIHLAFDGQITSDLMGEMPLDMEMTEVVTWTVTSVDADGLATIEVGVSEMTGSVSGVEIPAEVAEMPPTELVIASDGRIVSVGGMPLGSLGDLPGSGLPGMGQLTPILPDEGTPVAPGDTWEKAFSQEMPFGEGRIEITTTSRYDRNEDVDGRDAAVIVTEMTIPIDFSFDFADLAELGGAFGATGATGIEELSDASISYSGRVATTQTSFVDLDADELLRSESSGDVDMEMDFAGVPGLEGAMTFTGTFEQALELR